ncbi:MAG: hypothetical protein U0787_06985 [Polyangia bacterium]
MLKLRENDQVFGPEASQMGTVLKQPGDAQPAARALSGSGVAVSGGR